MRRIRYSAFSTRLEIHFLISPLIRAAIKVCCRKLKDGVSDSISKSLRRCTALHFVGNLEEVACQSTYCASNYFAKFLNCWNNTIMGRLKVFGGWFDYATAYPPTLITTGCKLYTFSWSLIVVHLSSLLKKTRRFRFYVEKAGLLEGLWFRSVAKIEQKRQITLYLHFLEWFWRSSR